MQLYDIPYVAYDPLIVLLGGYFHGYFSSESLVFPPFKYLGLTFHTLNLKVEMWTENFFLYSVNITLDRLPFMFRTQKQDTPCSCRKNSILYLPEYLFCHFWTWYPAHFDRQSSYLGTASGSRRSALKPCLVVKCGGKWFSDSASAKHHGKDVKGVRSKSQGVRVGLMGKMDKDRSRGTEWRRRNWNHISRDVIYQYNGQDAWCKSYIIYIYIYKMRIFIYDIYIHNMIDTFI